MELAWPGVVERLRALLGAPPPEKLDFPLDAIFDAHDAVLTPVPPGPAPLGLHSTRSPIFCTIWTLCGVPAISLPLLRDAAGLPVGVQLVGRRHDDGRLLRTARWLVRREGAPAPGQAPGAGGGHRGIG